MNMKQDIMEKPRILLVDDDMYMLESTCSLLRDKFSIKTANTVQQAKSILKKNEKELNPISALVVDLNFAGQEEDGIDLIQFVLKNKLNLPLVVLSGDEDTKRVIKATRLPIIDFVPKSGDHDEHLCSALYTALNKKKWIESKKQNAFKFQTNSLKLKEIFHRLDKVLLSGTKGSILIQGESGTGKEYMAKYLTSFLDKKMVAANMASIPKGTAESELFGHIKGAFTGAIHSRIGLIEQANHGVFFLDEIGDCSPEIQAKLLRVLEERKIYRVGSNEPRKIHIQFVAATHRNLDEMVKKGDFRLDLLQRLNTFIFHIPSLKNRPEDIAFYTRLFVLEISKEDSYYSIKDCAIKALQSYHWPGNVRELKSVIQRAMVYSDTKVLDERAVLSSLHISGEKQDIAYATSMEDTALTKDINKSAVLIKALNQSHGNKTKAAKLLGVDVTTIHRWIKKFKLQNSIPETKMGRPQDGFSLPRKAEDL